MRSGGGTILQRGLRQGPKWFAEQIRQGDIFVNIYAVSLNI